MMHTISVRAWNNHLQNPTQETYRAAVSREVHEGIAGSTWEAVPVPRSAPPISSLDGCPLCFGTGKVHSLQRCDNGFEFFAVGDEPVDQHTLPTCGHRTRPAALLASINGGIPERFSSFRLSALVPSAASHATAEQQAERIARLQAGPEKNWIMCGPPGHGKTTYAAALLIDAAWRKTVFERWTGVASIWRFNAYEVIQRHHERVTWNGPASERPKELVTATQIARARAAGHRPVLCLEEVEKLRMSDSAFQFVFSIVNAVHEAGGQVIVTSNMKPAALATHLRDEALWRRLSGGDSRFGGELMDMFA